MKALSHFLFKMPEESIFLKKLKEGLYLLSHPTNVCSWFLMWIFCVGSIFLDVMAAYHLVMVPLFGPVEDIMSAFEEGIVTFTISSILVNRELFMKSFKNRTSDKDQHNSKNSKK